MAGTHYRSVGGIHVCAPSNHLSDVNTLLGIVAEYKRLGGKLPPQVESALELAKAGVNAEASLNVACDGLFKYYVAQYVRCANEAGFSSLAQYEMAYRSDPDGDAVLKHERCVLGVERTWQVHNIEYVLNLSNPDSVLRQFLERTKDQVMGIASKYVKKAVLKKTRDDAPATPRLP